MSTKLVTDLLQATPEQDRREFMRLAAKSLLGVSIASNLPSSWSNAVAAPPTSVKIAGGGKAKSVIYLYMNGAMSHLDTFDPKPGAKSQGETQTTKTKVPGVEIADSMPRCAYLMNKLAIVRSLSTETGAHEQGRYLMHTSFAQLNSIRHPAMGAWASSILGKMNDALPPNVLIGSVAGHPGAGFLESAHSPVPIGNPAAGLENAKSPSYLNEKQFRRRIILSSHFDRGFRDRFDGREIAAYNQMYGEAVRLMGSKDLKVFDITDEDQKVKDFYGKDKLGQGCLLARRLVENGVRFVEVDYGGWDMHQDIFSKMSTQAGILDTALGALIRDLESKGLLETTMVVVATEFGRTPDINENAGRDHHPGAFSGLLCGGGIRGGQVWGASDSIGSSVEDDPVSVQDFNATIAYAMGMPLNEEFYAPNGRPFRVADHGEPLKALFT